MFLLCSGNISEWKESNRAWRIETSEIERETVTKALPEAGKFLFVVFFFLQNNNNKMV